MTDAAVEPKTTPNSNSSQQFQLPPLPGPELDYKSTLYGLKLTHVKPGSLHSGHVSTCKGVHPLQNAHEECAVM